MLIKMLGPRRKHESNQGLPPTPPGAVPSASCAKGGADDDADDDDWAPLPIDQVSMRPGERIGWAQGDAAAATSVESRFPGIEAADPAGDAVAFAAGSLPGDTAELSDSAKPPTASPDPEALRRLAELQRKCSACGPSKSLVTRLTWRDQRTRKRQALSERERSELEELLVTKADDGMEWSLPAGLRHGQTDPPSDADEAPPSLEFDRESDLDERELEPWFAELPIEEQERLRAAWHFQRHRFDWRSTAFRRRLQRAGTYGGGCFFLTCVMMMFLDATRIELLVFPPVGAVVAIIAELLGGERFTYAMMGAVGFVALRGAALFSNPFAFYGLIFAISTMSAVGLDREMRRTAGCRDGD